MRVLVSLCADFWYSELFDRSSLPDLVLVPAFSLTQWPSARSAKLLWRHMAVSRAYEFLTFVGISDWGPASQYRGQRSSAVAGFATPCPKRRETFFLALAPKRIAAFNLDFDRLRAFREDRIRRGFPVDNLDRE
jgi:hypothetical protein